MRPLARAFVAVGISADAVTIAGGLLTIVGAAFLAQGMPLAALLVLILGTLADTLDGQIAKASGGGTAYGAFLDSTVDRIADGALFAGATAYGASSGQPLVLWAALFALVASSLVPYVRAKAESLGVGASVGPAPREGRIVIFLIGLGAWAVLNLQALFVAAVVAVAVLSTFTFIQRVVHVGRELSIKGR
ncbi:MAG TPA: CDP-alcohol phosphatidyltransferase family protein [Candidatus Limnocylindria bacterium]|jgi:CDP-diacylglycerol--glycerol-3-phosphate 3-phosphatidyltransferase|nr:CDP-alcohol phosphatidyltransferase family protein [Candidatus Limnocylindria bacterium]